MTMFQKSMFGSSKAVGMFANRKGRQADLFGGLMPLRNDPPAREPLVGQTSFLDVVVTPPAPLATQQEGMAPALIVPADGQPAPSSPAHARPAAPSPTIDNVAAIIDLFSTAKANGIKWPKIRLQVAPGEATVVLALVGSGQNAGKIRVTNGGAYGDPDNVFYGFIDLDGRFSGARAWQGVAELLVKLSHDPAEVAAEYGKSTGECCFCGRPLTNGKAGSVDVGYGPICAERFELPWNPNGKDYGMVVGAAVVQAATVEAVEAEESPGIRPTNPSEQAALPAPKPMRALPSPLPTPYHNDELTSLEQELALMIDQQANMVSANERYRANGIEGDRYSVVTLKAGRSKISRLKAKVAKLKAKMGI